MEFVFTILLASATCYVPGLAQYSSAANAFANANAAYTGGSATASAYGYAYAYPPYNNGGARDCTYNRCTPTCSIPYPQNCPENINPCNCPSGTIISDVGGQCVRLEECERYINCKGDYNAMFTNCPAVCPSTCATPNYPPCHTNGCGPPGCQCKPGYILSAINGKCIKVEDCPGGNICGKNETYINCFGDCPSLYCPVNTIQVACGPTQPCVGGCTCKYKYLRKSVNDYTCILASECPPGKCSGVNEEWNRCASRCLSDSCKDRNKVPVPGDCPFTPDDCIPRCLCKKGFYRNGRTCVPEQECPPDSQ